MNRFEQAVYDCMIPTAELLAVTTKPLHRAILLNFWRHVHLEGAGEYERIVAPDMMVDEPVYRVTVRLPAQQVQAYGHAMSLQAGMAVDADIRLDRRRVIEWLFDPILSISRRV